MKNALVALALSSLALPVSAQLSFIQQPGTIKGSFQGTCTMPASGGGSDCDVYTVPEGVVARVTDIMVTNWSSSSRCDVRFLNGMLEFVVPPEGTFAYAFNNGPAYVAGSAISLRNTSRAGASCGGPIVTVRGYLFTVP